MYLDECLNVIGREGGENMPLAKQIPLMADVPRLIAHMKGFTQNVLALPELHQFSLITSESRIAQYPLTSALEG